MPQVKEVWRTVPGYPAYKVSNYGNVMSLWKRTGSKSTLKMSIGTEGRLLKKSPTAGGLVKVSLAGLGCRYTTVGIAHLVLMAFVRLPREGEIARHYHDPDPWNCNLYNLRWGTYADNAADAVRHNNGKHFNAGRVYSPEYKRRMAEICRGRKHTPETREKMRLSALSRAARERGDA